MNPHPWTHYEHLAVLFDYPGRDYPAWVDSVYRILAGRYPRSEAFLNEFARALPTRGEPFTREALDEVQEIFTRTFDVQAITTLSIGYVMFGDDYKRGELLVNLSHEMDDIGLVFAPELPDHLPNVLRLLARWEDRDLAAEFVREILHPAVERMVAQFDPRNVEERDGVYRKHFKTLIESSRARGSMFRAPLAAVVDVLRQDFGLGASTPSAGGSDFVGSVERELNIEARKGQPA